jgi:hypothetical protein
MAEVFLMINETMQIIGIILEYKLREFERE